MDAAAPPLPLARLPGPLRPKGAEGLIRLGRDHDGGYIVAAADVDQAEALISLGINEDWSFEEAFVARNRVPVTGYDASVGVAVFTSQVRAALFPLPKLRTAFDRWKMRQRFRQFFQGDRRHDPRFVGTLTQGNVVSMGDVLAASASQRIFLKMDIEGEEYRVLDTILEHQHRLTGLALEFHDCDLHLDRIERFVTRMRLPLVHLHVNNFAPCDTRSGVPVVLETTFSGCATLTDAPRTYPLALDQPCNRHAPDYRIDFGPDPDPHCVTA